jgi:hypothetical protein
MAVGLIEFTLIRLLVNSYVCYVQVVQALSSEVLTAVLALICDISTATPKPYLLIKEVQRDSDNRQWSAP